MNRLLLLCAIDRFEKILATFSCGFEQDIMFSKHRVVISLAYNAWFIHLITIGIDRVFISSDSHIAVVEDYLVEHFVLVVFCWLVEVHEPEGGVASENYHVLLL